MSSGLYTVWQPRYAEIGLATFPVREKRPAVSNYLRMGLPASRQLAMKFANDDAFGIACKPSKITVLDVDAPDERLLADALSEFGPTPFIVRSGSGNWQAWYRNGGEGRRVRPDPHRPIDILGNGFVVAPPSRTAKGAYTIVDGSLEDLARLPKMRRREPESSANFGVITRTETGSRNIELWRACMARARSCREISELMEAAAQMNTAFQTPLPHGELAEIVKKVWAKEESGTNWFGSGKIVPTSFADIDELMQNHPDAFLLKQRLCREHAGFRDTFFVANAMAETMPVQGWRVKRFAAARSLLEELGHIECVRPASSYHGPAVYRFKGGQI